MIYSYLKLRIIKKKRRVCFWMGLLHHEEMRIFKVRKRSEKSHRYVITRIYGFFVFSEICTFVQCGVRRNNIRRIFCRCVLKFTCEKTVRQCDSCSATQNLIKIKYAGVAWGYSENAVKLVSIPKIKYIL